MYLFASMGAVLRADSCSDSCKYPNPAFANLWLFFMVTTLVPILSLRACIRTLKLVELPLAQYSVQLVQYLVELHYCLCVGLYLLGVVVELGLGGELGVCYAARISACAIYPNPFSSLRIKAWGCRDLNSDIQRPRLEVCQVSVQPRILRDNYLIFKN